MGFGRILQLVCRYLEWNVLHFDSNLLKLYVVTSFSNLQDLYHIEIIIFTM